MLQDLPQRFSDDQLIRIVDAATVYLCACPAAVAQEVMRLREVYEYQQSCLSDGALMEQVHLRIAESTKVAHAEMEQCLDDVLRLEGWDRATLSMPDGLRELRNKMLD